ncbi:MAG: hypothetical protein ABSH08_07410 [Tepidisphaeraceae bacterium]|jgi:hypothetical protein
MLVDGKQISPKAQCLARNREFAHHEAGHAVASFLLGEGDAVKYISMLAMGKRGGCTMSSGRIDPFCAEKWSLSRRAKGYREVFHSMAGCAAQSKFESWRPNCLTMLWDVHKHAATPEGDDFELAWKGAEFAQRVADGRGTSLILEKIGGWADEVFDDPRVWKTTTALAAKLKYGVRMTGKDACRIMRRAWGGDETIPIVALDSKWIRRFYFIPRRLYDEAVMYGLSNFQDEIHRA